jgi:phage shock protein PspC (stress-responsive transcriptional regulator)
MPYEASELQLLFEPMCNADMEHDMSMTEALERLRALHESGALSASEYAQAKARVLEGAGTTDAAASSGSTAASALQRLRRSRSDRWLGGVCGGLALQLSVPSWVLRLGFCLLALCAGTGVLFYVLLWLFVPVEAA